MGVLKGKTITTAIIVLLAAMILFTLLPTSVYAVDNGANGAADVATRLGITGYRAWVFSAITSVGTAIAWLGGTLFDLSISNFAANMVGTMDSLGLRVAVNNLWVIIRDLFNLLFIFGLIYSGFKIILDANDSASKKNIVTIVMAALLINFSLYASQIIVDFANVATYQIFQLMAAPEGETFFGVPTKNVSDSFIYLSGVDTLGTNDQKAVLLSEVGAQTGEAEVNNIGSAILLGLLFCLFYIVLGFVFAACAALLFTRFFTLTVLMIFSPMMFLGWVLPGLKSHTNKWWDKFTNQALVGPALLFMIYLSLRALQGIGSTGQDGGLIAVSLYLIIVTAFLWASLKVANSLGAYGAAQAISMGQNLAKSARGYAGGAVFGGVARLGRSTAGRYFQNKADSDEWKKAAANSRWGRLKWKVASKVGDTSFDARNVAGVGKKLGLGKGIKGGYKTQTEQVTKREKEIAAKLGTVSDEDPEVQKLKSEVDFSEQDVKQRKENIQELRKKLATAPKKEREDIQARIEAAKAELEDAEERHSDQKEALQREKQRFQLGTVAPVGESAHLDEMVKQKKREIKNNMAQYSTSTDEYNKQTFKEAVMRGKKELSELEKKRDRAMGGYANTVENFGVIKNFFLGRNKAQNEEAAKTIRDEYKKKIKSKDKDKPKEKEDKGDKGKEEDKEAA